MNIVMFSNVFGSLLSSTGASQTGGRRKAAPRGSQKNGKGKPFMGYEKLTLVELQKKAKKYKVAGYSKLTKTELIAALRKK